MTMTKEEVEKSLRAWRNGEFNGLPAEAQHPSGGSRVRILTVGKLLRLGHSLHHLEEAGINPNKPDDMVLQTAGYVTSDIKGAERIYRFAKKRIEERQPWCIGYSVDEDRTMKLSNGVYRQFDRIFPPQPRGRVEDEAFIRIGCQVIPWSEIQYVADELGWEGPMPSYQVVISFFSGHDVERSTIKTRKGSHDAVLQALSMLENKERQIRRINVGEPATPEEATRK